ncbi:MAG: SAM-dependent methyltransferase [Gammaproteobacteria bacterium]|nr:SAM-dependent methyltransferase [Gammaproteobacteria bacterium]MDH5346102.1 SAM-dependent methyltransferase [Gammaproteobacteria bacterium]
MKPKPGLPAPDPAGAAHSERVAGHIGRLIDEAGGDIPFAAFMQEALYAPGLGYYVAGAPKFGASGDFVTAPEISALFGYVLARQIAGALGETGGDLLEFGAGTGALAVALLERLGELDALPRRYLILEVSAELRECQERRLAAELPDLMDRIEWLDGMPASFSGVVIANEVLDAMPVERFRMEGNSVLEARVSRDDNGFCFRYAPAPRQLEGAVRRIEEYTGSALPHGYQSEWSPGIANWIRDVAAALHAGTILLIDYGVSRREYYAPDRDSGWLRCHFRHHVHDDPLILAGMQDITAWIDFTAVAESAVAAGLDVCGYATQGHFLLHGGLHLELEEFALMTQREQAELSGQVKLLTLPAEMGENFKIIALSKGSVKPPPAFAECDSRHRL